MTPAVAAVIRPSALRENLARVRSLAAGCRVLAVIKANAYGHGLTTVARVLADADALAVARLEEALELRNAGIAGRLVVLGGFASADELATAAALRLDMVVHSAHQVELLRRAAGDQRVWVWLKIDSGMGRLGITPAAAPDCIRELRAAAAVADITLMTHLASADDRSDPATEAQLRTFAAAAGDWPGDVSIANSAAILQWPEALHPGVVRYGGENWVRPGLMLFGASPLRSGTAMEQGLRPAMSFESRLISVKPVARGTRVGYGGHWVAPGDARLAVAAAGYADGYPWHIAGGCTVLIRGQRASVVGRVSMDMITIDVTAIADAAVGDRVVLWGDAPTVEEVAAAARTIPYTLMTGLNRRVALTVAADL